MNEENSTGKINKLAFWPAVIALVVFVIAGIVNTQAVGNAMTKILSVIANYFGAYINILSLVFLILAAVIIIGKYGDVIIGGKDAKPDYNMPTWCAMSICSGIGTGLLFWAIGEPIFHYMQTPTAIGQAQTRTAGIFAVAQAMWIGVFTSMQCMQSAEQHLRFYVLTRERVYQSLRLWNVLQIKRFHG